MPEITLTDRQFKDLARLTKVNAHGHAYESGAEFLGLDDLKARLRAINEEHARRGYLTYELHERRYRHYTELMQEAGDKLSPDQFKKFYACF